MAAFQPAPTYADVILIDPVTNVPRFNPLWLKWFLEVSQSLGATGSTGTLDHNSLSGLQGGGSADRYHLTATQVGVVTGVTSGVAFAPAVSAAVNLASTPTMTAVKYVRISDQVFMSGQFTADPTAVGTASFEFTLPVASNFAAENDLSGTAHTRAGDGAEVFASAANNGAKVQWIVTDIASNTWSWLAQYRII